MTTADETDLREYTTSKSNAAMTRLVGRHIDFIYGVARRQVSDPGLADDVTQAVFLILSRSAGRVKPAALMGWLFTTTRQVASNANKAAARRRHHERRAAELRGATAMPAFDDQSEHVQHHLHRALATQREADRSLVLMRYVQGMDVTDIGKLLGVSDKTARKRIERAVDRLREALQRQGVAVGSGGVSSSLAAVAQAAPARLFHAINAGQASQTVVELAQNATSIAVLPLILTGVAALILIGGTVIGIWSRLLPALAAPVVAVQSPTTVPASGPAAQAEPAMVRYAGTVRDASGNPVAGVRIWSDIGGTASGAEKVIEAETQSDLAGHYSLPPLPAVPESPGTGGSIYERRIIFDHPGHALAWRNRRADDDAKEETEDVDMSMTFEPAAPLRVHVIDAAGNPIPGASITLQLQHITTDKPSYVRLTLPLTGDIRSDASGDVIVDRIPQNARAHIVVKHPDYATFQTALGYNNHEYPIRPGYGPMVVTMHPGGGVRVRLKANDGMTLPAAVYVGATGKSAGTVNSSEQCFLDADGTFRLSGLYPGTYDLNVIAADAEHRPTIWQRIRNVQVEAGQERSVETAQVRTQQIEGRVINEATKLPMPRASVSISSELPEINPFWRSATSDAGGRFQIVVPVGEVTLTTAGYRDGKYASIERKVTVVKGQDLSIGDILAGEPPTMRGRLVDSNGRPAPGWVETWFGRFKTAPDGTFAARLSGGGSGEKTFIAATNFEKTLGRMVGMEAAMLDPKLAAPGATLPAITLKALTSVEMRVVDPRGKPMEGATVMLSVPSPTGYGRLYNTPPWGGFSDGDGRFVINQLPAGLNGLSLWIDKGGLQNHVFLEPLQPGEIRDLQQLVVSSPAYPEDGPNPRPPQLTPMEFNQTLIGRVVNASGQPVVGADVQAGLNRPGLNHNLQDTTDHEGRFIFKNLPRGQRISITARGSMLRDARLDTTTDAENIEIRVGGLAADLIGKPAPELTVSQWLNSPPIRLAELRGKVVLIAMNLEFDGAGDVSGTLSGAARRFDREKLSVIAVHCSPDRSHERLSPQTIKEFISNRQISYPVAIDATPQTIPKYQGWTGGETATRYQIMADGGMVLIDKTGIVRGPVDQANLNATIEKLLAE